MAELVMRRLLGEVLAPLHAEIAELTKIVTGLSVQLRGNGHSGLLQRVDSLDAEMRSSYVNIKDCRFLKDGECGYPQVPPQESELQQKWYRLEGVWKAVAVMAGVILGLTELGRFVLQLMGK